MHPDNTAPNPLPFATARNWDLSRLDRLDGIGSGTTPAFDIESTVTPPHRIRQLDRIARAWQLGLVIGCILIAPTTAASVLFALTAH